MVEIDEEIFRIEPANRFTVYGWPWWSEVGLWVKRRVEYTCQRVK